MEKILLAYDGSEPAKRALDRAAQLAKAMGASVTVVSVIPARRGPAPLDPWDDRQVHTDELLEAKHLLAGRGIDARLLEPAGEPARTIEQVADEGEFDVVILGSRGLGAVARAFEGSVSAHVATHAHQTVVIVH